MSATGPCENRAPSKEESARAGLNVQPAGVSVRLEAVEPVSAGAHAGRTQTALAIVLAEGLPVTARVAGLACTEPVQAFEALCKRLARATREAGVDARALTIAVDAHDIDPVAAWSIRRELLGRGALYFVGTDARLESDAVLRRLWLLRSELCVGAAFWPLVNTPTPLLENERGDDLLPLPALQAPLGTAWVWGTINIASCAGRSATDTARLDSLLVQALTEADDAHSRCRWPTAAARHDAWLNRRVALELTGVGDWVAMSGIDPSSLDALSAVDRLLATAAARLKAQSLAMAAGNRLPAINAVDPCRRLPKGCNVLAWQRYWQSAVDRAGIGHRNLLVASPWSLFASGSADTGAFNLLPALRHVDACTFRRRLPIDDWCVDAFREFHRRAWAVMRRNARPSLVAQQL